METEEVCGCRATVW